MIGRGVDRALMLFLLKHGGTAWRRYSLEEISHALGRTAGHIERVRADLERFGYLETRRVYRFRDGTYLVSDPVPRVMEYRVREDFIDAIKNAVEPTL